MKTDIPLSEIEIRCEARLVLLWPVSDNVSVLIILDFMPFIHVGNLQ